MWYWHKVADITLLIAICFAKLAIELRSRCVWCTLRALGFGRWFALGLHDKALRALLSARNSAAAKSSERSPLSGHAGSVLYWSAYAASAAAPAIVAGGSATSSHAASISASLAALMAVIWDSMLSPGDARTLTPGQMDRDQKGAVFFLDRAKTGRAAAGTLTPWSEKLLADYREWLGAELLDNAPIFRTAGSEPGPKGGRRWLPQPYSTSRMDSDFREVRKAVFGADEDRQLADMRRSGAVEGDAGGGTLTDQSNKMANTVAASRAWRDLTESGFPNQG